MRTTLTALIFTLFCLAFGGSYAQNNCASPTAIGAIPYTSPTGVIGKHSTCGKVAEYGADDACGNTYIRSESYVYKFTAAAGVNCINIDLSASITIGGNTCPGVFLFDGCPDQPATNCVAQGINPLTGSGTKNVSIKNVSIKPGATYFVVVSADTGCYTYTLAITKGTCPNANDTIGRGCAQAHNIPVLPWNSGGGRGLTTCGKGHTYNTGNPCNSYYMDAEAYTFKYHSPVDQCANVTVNTNRQNSSLYIYENCPTSGDGVCLTQLTGSYNYVMKQFVTFEAGKDYYFVVSGYNAFDTCQNFDFAIQNIPIIGTTCADAITVPPLPANMQYQTTRCKNNDYNQADACGSSYMNGNDVVYKYTSPGNECISVTLKNITSYTGLYLFNACPDDPAKDCIAMDSAYYTFTPTYGLMKSIDVEAELTTPGVYYIVVANQYAYTGYDTDFDMVVASSNPNDDGARCETAYQVDSLNFSGTNYNTGCKGTDYHGTTACSDIGSRGNDIVFKIESDRDGCAKIIARNITSRAGFYLVDLCPDDTNSSCLASALCDNYGCDSVGLEYTFEKGKTYYLVASAAEGFASISFDLDIRPYAESTDTCQVCSEYVCKACKNIGFDLADFTGWTGYEGIYSNPKQTAVINPGTINNSSTRHTVMSAGSVDPVVGKDLPVVSPFGGNYAARLGNSINGAQAEVLKYTYTVDSNTNNFYYYYAVVLEDGGHLPADQPFFETNVFDDKNGKITCGYYQVSAAANVPGFEPVKDKPGVNWKNWTLVSIPLINYQGREVTIEFTTKDCSQGGHFGYAYIDAFCGKAEILRADKEGRPIQVNGNTGFLCKDSSITLTAPSGYKTYTWSDGQTGQTITVNKAGTYDVVVESVSGCTAIIRSEIKEAKDPVANFNFEQPCSGVQVGFHDISQTTDTFNITSWKWDFGDGGTATSKDPTHNYPAAGNYNVKLKVTTKANCTHETTQAITIKPPVQIPPIGALDSILVCTKDSIHLYSNTVPTTTVKWEGPKGFKSTEVSPSIANGDTLMTGNYIITMKYGDCDNAKDTTYVTVLPFPKFSVTKDTNVCFTYSGINLKATGGRTYDWSPAYMLDAVTGAQVKCTTDQTTTYSVLISNDVCPDSLMKVKITVDDYTDALVADDMVSNCVGKSVSAYATADPDKYIEWTGPGGTITKDSLVMNNLTVPQKGYYKVKSYLGPNHYCQFGFDSVLVNVNPLPVPAASPIPNSICYNDSGFALASGGSTYEWKNGATLVSGSAKLAVHPLATTTYDLTAKSDSGCTASMSYTLQVKSDFKVDLGPDKIACVGDTLYIGLIGPDFDRNAASFNWNDGSTDSTLMLTTTGDYTITVTNNGCVKSDVIHVNFQQPSSFSIGQDQTICSNDSFLIDLSTVNGTVNWTDGYPGKSRYINDPGGTFGVVVLLGTCTLSDSITITSQQQHAVNIGPDSTICLGNTLTLNSPYPSDLNEWVDGATNLNSPNYTVSSVGAHNVILFVSIGECTNSDTAVITIQQPPVFSFGPDTTVCQDVPVLLKATTPQASAYLWNGGSTQDTLTAFAKGLYDVSITVGVCTIYDTIEVKHDSIPVFTLGPDQNLCNGQNTTIGTNVPGDKYTWSTGATTNNIMVTSTNDYELQIDRGKCKFKDKMKTSFQAPPPVDLGPNYSVCDKLDTVLIASQTGATYNWTTGEYTDEIHITTGGMYGVTVTQGPCTSSDTIYIVIQPQHSVDLPNDDILCKGVTKDLKTTTNAGTPTSLPTFHWNTGQSSQDITVDSTYSYVVEVSYGVCKNSDTVLVTFVAPPSVNLGDDSIMCSGNTLALDATYQGSSYLWSTGEITPTIQVGVTGIYSVMATIGPCHDEDTIDLTFKIPPVLQLMPDAEICNHEKLQIAGTIPNGLTYAWSTGETTPNITVTQTGTYVLQVSDLPCMVTDTFNLVVNPVPAPNLHDTIICPTDSAYFDAYWENAVSYLWGTGETTSAIWAYPGQLTDVKIVSDKGCVWEQPVHAVMDRNCPEEIYIPNAFTPNNDNVNDVFRVITGNVKLHEVVIYNRWGEMLYKYTDPKGGWDGKYLGEFVKEDVYNVRVVYSTIYHVKKAIATHVSVLK